MDGVRLDAEGRRCDVRRLELLEARLQVELPPIYRSWLIETNGGWVRGQCVFEVPTATVCFQAGEPDTTQEVESFHGCFGPDSSHDVASVIAEFPSFLLEGCLPIGWALESCVLAIRLRVVDCEAIWYSDIAEERHSDGSRKYHRVGDDIRTFIASLREPTED